MEPFQLLIDVREIFEDLGGTVALDLSVELPDIMLGSETFAPTRDARVQASVTNTGAGIVVSGTVDAEFRATCARCLREFPLPITSLLEAFYVAEGDADELPEEQEVGFITEGSVDLMEQVLSSLALDLPFAPLHAEDCPGICPTCGKDLTEGFCACGPAGSDSPFAGLKGLFENDEGV